MISKDILWKGIIEDLFEDFLRFFYRDRIEEIDFEGGFEFLDKELQQIFPDNESKRRYADKLVKVFINGKEQWLLIHIEIQGYYDKKFSQRMFNTFYRILDKYQKPISALAIFTDSQPGFHPKKYTSVQWGTKLIYEYQTYKVLEKRKADFDVFVENPFSMVMKTVWIDIKNKQDVNRLEMKLKLARQLIKSGYDKPKVHRVLNFIGHYVKLQKPEEINKFETVISHITKNKGHMGILEAIEEELKRQAIEEGKAEGLEIGRAEGLEQGIEQGHQLGVLTAYKEQVLKLHNKGLSFEEIRELLELDIDFVKDTIEEQQHN
ncbi:MAG TPA: hypothetical protein ENK75_00485 [Saprospiraceae bacterium]|nr:hypothetical protein [Saprospiraceae bacterium]